MHNMIHAAHDRVLIHPVTPVFSQRHKTVSKLYACKHCTIHWCVGLWGNFSFKNKMFRILDISDIVFRVVTAHVFLVLQVA